MGLPSLLNTEPHDGLNKCKDFENQMFYPSNFVTCVTTICEKIIQPTVESKVWLCKKFFLDNMCMSILRSYVSLKSDELKNLHEHTFELVKTLITTYVVLQLKHHMKEGNERIKKKTDQV